MSVFVIKMVEWLLLQFVYYSISVVCYQSYYDSRWPVITVSTIMTFLGTISTHYFPFILEKAKYISLIWTNIF